MKAWIPQERWDTLIIEERKRRKKRQAEASRVERRQEATETGNAEEANIPDSDIPESHQRKS